MNEPSFAVSSKPRALGWPWGLASSAYGHLAASTMRASVDAAFVRSALTLRTLWALLVLATVAGPSLIEPLPTAAGPVVVATLGWSVFVRWLSRQEDFPTAQVARLDAVIFATMLLGQASLVPPPLVGDGTNWVFVGASVSVFIASLLLGAAETIAITCLLIVAYLAGLAAAGQSVVAPDGLPTSFLLLVQGVVCAAAVALLRGTAARADEALEREAVHARVAVMEQQKEHERSAQERLLHNKVLSTLWLIGNGHLVGRRSAALDSCQESLGALRDLRNGRIADELTRSASHAVHKAVAWARSVGLDVTLSVQADAFTAPADPPYAGSVDSDGDIPAVVCEALCAATRQVLANVLKHAGVQSAHVDVVSNGGNAQVTVQDNGRGFDLSDVATDRQGIRTSIVGAMRDVGGYADVQSEPGGGTTVTLTWQATPASVPAPTHPEGSGALRIYGVSFLFLLAGAGLVFHGLSLFATLHFAHDYAHPWVPLVAWAAQLAVGVGLVAGIVFGRPKTPKPWIVWCGVGIALAAAAAVTLDCHTRGVLGFANWTFGETVWPLCFAAAYLPLQRVALALAVHDIVQTAVISIRLGADLQGLLKLSAIALVNTMLQIGLAVAFAVLVRTTNVTARAVWESGRHRTDLYRRRIVRRARSIRAAGVDSEVYALLESVSSGCLDPDDLAARRRFRSAGQKMRREDAFAEASAVATGLSSVAEQAAQSDIEVEIDQTDGFSEFPEPVRDTMLSALTRLLEFASPGKAVIALHKNADLTLRDWEDFDQESHMNVHTLTLSFLARKSAVHNVREQVAAWQRGADKGLVFDVDIDIDNTTGAQVWLAIATR